MLPSSRRLKRPADFGAVFRQGVRAATSTVVVHMRRVEAHHPPETRVGFVVSKKVGNAVVRNRVKRRLRHLMASRDLPSAVHVVVRALPPAATAVDLGDDLSSALRRSMRKLPPC